MVSRIKARISYLSKVLGFQSILLGKAYERFKGSREPETYGAFCKKNAHWLKDYALFVALRSRFEGKAWSDWNPDFRDRHAQTLEQARDELQDEIKRFCFYQYLLFEQWMERIGLASYSLFLRG